MDNLIKPFDIFGEKAPRNNYAPQLQQINNNICQGNALMQNYANYIDTRLNEAMQKKKKKCISHMIVTTNMGEIKFAYIYDDKTADLYPYIYNYYGNWRVFRLKFKKTEQKKEYFAIQFETMQQLIFGEIKKYSVEGLYTHFVGAEVKFNSDIAEGIRKKTLFETFEPLIKNCIDEYKIPELAGWYNNDFLFASIYPYRNMSDLPKLPIMEKEFNIVSYPNGAIKYIKSILEISQYKHRIIVLLIPLIGILSSFFASEGIEKMAFNFVCLNKKYSLFLPKLFQVFNRNLSEVFCLDSSEKEIREKLMGCNDEVVMIDIMNDCGTAYQKKKSERAAQKITEKMTFYGNTAFNIQREVNSTLIILNHTIMKFPTVLNLFVDDDFFCEKSKIEDAVKEKYIDAFFTEFVRFIQENINETRRKIQKMKYENSDNKKLESIVIAWEIFTWFCDSEGIDLEMILQLPHKINFNEIYAEEFESGDLMEAFVKIVRSEIKQWKVIQKNRKVDADFVSISCFYDDEYLYLPTKIFDRMLGKNGYLPKKFNILSALKEKEILKTNVEGLSCRFQVNGQRFETYKFRISFFNKPGYPDIISLGKEEK